MRELCDGKVCDMVGFLSLPGPGIVQRPRKDLPSPSSPQEAQAQQSAPSESYP